MTNRPVGRMVVEVIDERPVAVMNDGQLMFNAKPGGKSVAVTDMHKGELKGLRFDEKGRLRLETLSETGASGTYTIGRQ